MAKEYPFLADFVKDYYDLIVESVDSAFPDEMVLIFRESGNVKAVLTDINTGILALLEAYSDEDRMAVVDAVVEELHGTEDGRSDGCVWVFVDAGESMGLVVIPRESSAWQRSDPREPTDQENQENQGKQPKINMQNRSKLWN